MDGLEGQYWCLCTTVGVSLPAKSVLFYAVAVLSEMHPKLRQLYYCNIHVKEQVIRNILAT